jgi:hypothetical protein
MRRLHQSLAFSCKKPASTLKQVGFYHNQHRQLSPRLKPERNGKIVHLNNSIVYSNLSNCILFLEYALTSIASLSGIVRMFEELDEYVIDGQNDELVIYVQGALAKGSVPALILQGHFLVTSVIATHTIGYYIQ